MALPIQIRSQQGSSVSRTAAVGQVRFIDIADPNPHTGKTEVHPKPSSKRYTEDAPGADGIDEFMVHQLPANADNPVGMYAEDRRSQPAVQ